MTSGHNAQLIAAYGLSESATQQTGVVHADRPELPAALA